MFYRHYTILVSIFMGKDKKDDLANIVSDLSAVVEKLKISDSLNSKKYSQLLNDFVIKKH